MTRDFRVAAQRASGMIGEQRMLIIRDAQLRAFESHMERRFASRVRDQLRWEALIPPTQEDGDVLLDRIHASIRDAERLGLTDIFDLYRFAAYDLWWGPRFYEREGFAAARTVLHDPAIDGSDKMDRVGAQIASRPDAPRALQTPPLID